MNTLKAVCFLAALLFASVPLALAQGTYTQIDVPGGLSTTCYGINANGDIVGSYVTPNHATDGFILSEGTYTTYHRNEYTEFSGINDTGQVVGYASVPGGVLGFVYDLKSQTFTKISIPGATNTFPYAINTAGSIAGTAEFPDVGFEQDGSGYRRMIKFPGANRTVTYGISDSGVVLGFYDRAVGVRYFLFNRGKYRRLSIPNAPNASVYGISPAGTAFVGVYFLGSRGVGFLYQNKTLQTLEFPGGTYTEAHGVNAAGEVTGIFFDQNGYSHGFIWTPPADAAKK